jgi:predicted acylesterase/phospholipase RssA
MVERPGAEQRAEHAGGAPAAAAPPPRRVFILAGGAALGAHHVGALRYLGEQGITPDHIVASSIGVINACVYLTGGVPLLEEAWRRFWSLPQIADLSLRHNPVLGLSLFSMDRLTRALEEYMDFPKIRDSTIGLDVIVLNLSRGVGEVYSKDAMGDWRELRTLTRAGYAIPLLFPPVRLRGDAFVDGGFAWNIPLDHAMGLRPTEIYLLAPIASQLPYQGGFRSFAGFVTRFLDVMWRTIGNMGYLYARMEDGCYHGVPVTIIEPGEEYSGFALLGTFHAYPGKSTRLIAAGYRDAKRVMARRPARERRARASAGRPVDPS